jgi:lysozyme
MKPSKKIIATSVAAAIAAGGLSPSVINLSVAMFDHWEGRNYTAVHLKFDPPGVITVCGGVTNYDLPKLKIGDKFTEAECQKLIASLIPKYAAPVEKCVHNFTRMPDHRQAALISFVINLGPAKVCGTSIARDLNAGRVTIACNAMTKYIAADGKRLQGLVNRRNDPVWGEKPWCLMKDTPSLKPWWQRMAAFVMFKEQS